MPDGLNRPENAAQILRGKEGIIVDDPARLMAILPYADPRTQAIRIQNLPIILEEYYVRGDQTPYNRYQKHALTVQLPRYGTQAERNRDAKPFYLQRREAFEELHRRRRERLEQGDNGFLYYRGISWKPDSTVDNVTRVLPIVADMEGVERFLVNSRSDNPIDRPRLRYEYEPEQAKLQGAIAWFSLVSLTGQAHYRQRESGLHNLAVYNNQMMYSIIAGLTSTHMCGYKQNMLTKFAGRDRTLKEHIFCQHDVEAILVHIAEFQRRFREGEQVDTIYDRVERQRATIPMYTNPILIPTSQELQVYRFLAHNTTIKRPKRDRQNGGFLRNTSGEIVWDKERPLWETEIEPVMWTLVAEIGRDAMFLRHRFFDLPPFR